MFHLLIHDATRTLVSIPELRGRFSRAFDHGDMKAASRAFANAQRTHLEKLTGGISIPADLRTVAENFGSLQEARHEADYDLSRTFTRLEVDDLVTAVEQTFQLWQTVRSDPASQIYLAALLLWKKWNR